MAPNVPLEASSTATSFLFSALRSNLRPDGRRSFHSPLPLSLSLGSTPGTCSVSIGTSKVITHIVAELTEPRSERPYEGTLDCKIEVGSIAGVQFERNRTGDEELKFERAVERAVRRCQVVDREALCVVAGQKVWSITLFVHLLSWAGLSTSVDAAVLSSLLSLRSFRRPDVSVEGGASIPRRRGPLSSSASASIRRNRAKTTLHDPASHAPIPLALHHTPLSVTLVYFDIASHQALNKLGPTGKNEDRRNAQLEDDGQILLVDPDPLEAELADAVIQIVATPQGDICSIDHAGGKAISPRVLRRAINLARERVKDLSKRCDTVLKANETSEALEVR
ncbi:Exosomal 3'-5' exoribonuclease complex, subunit Rrp45 [Ceraceosorus bombacis]|uniref:Exosomal 3'-5' exoribonuclease complex, subunit Rrp45 n=1 Tax=Ceraceosorus bombacis TaxID=401625 RepID=A0A0P1BEI8_9BASI|nr:Exosomal 3'-5' exoribonuclease complex, subunit Rrp45 [Ceraceosorus bombacis]